MCQDMASAGVNGRRRRSERMKQSLEGDGERQGEGNESDGGCGPYLYLGDIVLVWADVGA